MSTNHNERAKDLGIVVDRATVHKILSTGRAFDISSGGMYDARSGVVNFWCSPEDKPTCWDKEILPGDLGHPRDYVGGLYWDWLDDDRVKLRLDATPYQLLDARRKALKPRYGQPVLTDEEWDSVMVWLEAQAQGLLRLVDLHPTVKGSHCPYCKFVLPVGHLFNDMLAHITDVHNIDVVAVLLGEPTQLTVMVDGKPETVTIHTAESFE